MHLPGEWYRSEERGSSPDHKSLWGEIDFLLVKEFDYLDLQRIRSEIDEARQVGEDMINRYSQEMILAKSEGREKPNFQEFKMACAPQLERGRLARDELYPLYSRLVELGFDHHLLCG